MLLTQGAKIALSLQILLPGRFMEADSTAVKDTRGQVHYSASKQCHQLAWMAQFFSAGEASDTFEAGTEVSSCVSVKCPIYAFVLFLGMPV